MSVFLTLSIQLRSHFDLLAFPNYAPGAALDVQAVLFKRDIYETYLQPSPYSGIERRDFTLNDTGCAISNVCLDMS